tara:strand:- start:311 stop:772 length:462 start_codon:yes stop_codon:yes gene_type:complete
MKLSELKEQIKELYLQEENSVEDIEAKTKATQDLTAATQELNKVTMSEFKNYLRQEILAEIAEQEDEEEVSDDVEIETPDGEAEVEPISPELTPNKRDTLDDIGDQLVLLAKKAKETGEEELANQILNSAKFTEKKEFQAVSQDVGVQDRGAS